MSKLCIVRFVFLKEDFYTNRKYNLYSKSTVDKEEEDLYIRVYKSQDKNLDGRGVENLGMRQK